MLAIESIQASRETRERMERKPDSLDGRCLLCSAPVREERALYVHVHEGGSTIVTEVEAAELNKTQAGADLGFLPIGPECARKNRDSLKDYANGYF
jgi:hypothetical protein